MVVVAVVVVVLVYTQNDENYSERDSSKGAS